MSALLTIGLGIGIFTFVLACLKSKTNNCTINPKVLEWFELQEAAKALGQYPSTLGDKQRFLQQAERYLANNSPPRSGVALGKTEETFTPATQADAVHDALLTATRGQAAQIEQLSRAGKWSQASALAGKAIANAFQAVQPPLEVLIGQKLPRQGVLGFEYSSFSITVKVESDAVGEALPSTIADLDVYFINSDGRRQRAGQPRWDADLIESPYRSQAKKQVAVTA
ncbi:MAG: hypothetical protein K2Z81_08870 [Cyanobacteria bacterium]|nr:hypothetical protein [Cyanobacteriota bacterium]